MSLGSEARIDMEIEHELLRAKIAKDANAGIWTTRDGRDIAVRDMTTSHIRNTIRFLEQRNAFDMFLPWITVFENELKRRGEENNA